MPHYHLILTQNTAYLLTFITEDRRHATMTVIQTEVPIDDHPLGRLPWIVTGIARCEPGSSFVGTVANALTGFECPVTTSRILAIHQVSSVEEALVEAVFAQA